jgi:hypothetical protein
MASEITGSGTCIEVIDTLMRAVGEGVAGVTVDAEQGDDVAGVGLVDVLHLVGVHADQAADLDLLAGAAVDDGVALATACPGRRAGR